MWSYTLVQFSYIYTPEDGWEGCCRMCHAGNFQTASWRGKAQWRISSSMETAQGEQWCTNEDYSTKGVERNGQPELKAPRVLDVFCLYLKCIHKYEKSFFLANQNWLVMVFIFWGKVPSASGLRALRYACEVERIGQVVALNNDIGC